MSMKCFVIYTSLGTWFTNNKILFLHFRARLLENKMVLTKDQLLSFFWHVTPTSAQGRQQTAVVG